jgi:hypothetical protein
MSSNTDNQYNSAIKVCRDLFLNKTADYGTSWRILRESSITDQIWIKAARIRSIQIKWSQQVDDPIQGEFIGIVNYCIIAQIQSDLGHEYSFNIDLQEVTTRYDNVVEQVKELLARKNSDYGEGWRDMRISSMVDLILQKLLRVKQIEDNDGKTKVSEGTRANYQDIMNYAIFCMIRMSEKRDA